MTNPVALLASLCGASAPGVPGGLFVGLLLAGAAGSVMHCAPMCGPFVLGQVSDRLAQVPAARLCERQRIGSALLLPYHAGRLTTYAALGALAGTAGATLRHLPWFKDLESALLFLAAALFLAHALRRLAPTIAHVLPGTDRAPAAWVRLVRRVSGRMDRTTTLGGLVLGLALGFLPCGFLYAALAAAAATTGPATGALAMFCFGLGTIPSLVAVGAAGVAAGHRFHRGVTALAPAVLLLNAVLLGLLAWGRFTTAI